MNQAAPHIQSRQDRDRIRQQAALRKAAWPKIERLVTECEQGRAASACMSDLKKIVKGRRP